MYFLPGEKKIDENRIYKAMTDSNIFNRYFLDIEIGKVKFISEEFDYNCNEALDEVKKDLNKRYFEIPKISDKEKHLWMKEFVEEMIEDGTLKNKLNFILSKSQDFHLFERILYNDKSGWIWGWVQWKVNYLGERIGEWLDGLNIGAEDKEEYFDDCPICQMMKKTKEESREPSEEELREAYQKAGGQGGVVGGEWFKDEVEEDK